MPAKLLGRARIAGMGLGVPPRAYIGAMLYKKCSATCMPRQSWRAAIHPDLIHRSIPGLCAQVIEIAAFLTNTRRAAGH